MRVLATLSIAGVCLAAAACQASLNVAAGGETEPSSAAGPSSVGAPAATRVDTVVMTAGPTRVGRVLAKNSEFYVFEPLPKQRTLEAIPLAEIETIRWARGKEPADLEAADQVVLNNGLLLHGRITKMSTPAGFLLIDGWHGEFSYQAQHSQISRVFRAGEAVSLGD